MFQRSEKIFFISSTIVLVNIAISENAKLKLKAKAILCLRIL
jgi:hypothetical protein